MTVPGAWAGVLLALATYRVLRLLMLDEITAPLRHRLLVTDGDVPRSEWLLALWSCPWCLGWWVSLIVFAAYEAWPHGTLVISVPFALSAGCGIIGRNLDA